MRLDDHDGTWTSRPDDDEPERLPEPERRRAWAEANGVRTS